MADNEEELRALLANQPRNLIVTASDRLAEVQTVFGADAPMGYVNYGSKRRVWIEWPPPKALPSTRPPQWRAHASASPPVP